MFVGKESNSSGWKQWGIDLVDNTLSSVDQAISGWFWNLISDLPRDYFAKTFDQVNYLDRRVWEGIFRASIEGIKEQLESGVSKKTFEADIIRLQGLIGKHSLSPLVYEDGLKELEDFVSDSNNSGKYLEMLANIRNEFREELRAQPLLLKECIKNDTNLGRREVAYYQSLLDSTSSKETPVEPSALGESIVSSVVRKNRVTNSKLRNISKLLFCNPAQAVTLFLAGQVVFANAVSIQLNNSSAVENSTLLFDDTFMSVSEAKENRTVSLDTFTENTVIENSKHFFCGNSTFEVEESVIVNTEKSSHSPFTKAFNDEIEKVKNEIDKLIIALTQTELDKTVKVDVLRSQRSISSNTINNPNPSGSFTRPNLSSKAAKLENEMRKMKEDIAQLKQSFTISSGDKERLASLETTIETLKRLLDDQSRETEQKIANLESLVESLINVVNSFRKELDDMKKKAAEQETIQKQKGLPTECVEAIKSHNFKVAEEKLQEINDNSKINLIIKEVYNYQIANFDLVLKFGDDIQNIKRSFLVYKALNYEMESSGHNDNVKVKKLIESLEREIINQENTSSGVKKEAYSLTGKLIAKVSERNINPWLYKAVSNLEVFKPFVDAMEERGISVSTAKDNDGDSLLHKAAMNDHLDVVKYLINEKRVDVNAKNYLGSTPLHYATLDGHLDIIRYFIDEKHVDVNVKNYLGSTPLHYAALNGHLDVVKYFVDEKHADFNAESDVGFTPLHAAYSGHSDVVKYLLSKNPVNVNAHNDVGFTPLHYAALCGLVDVAKHLINEKHVNANIQDNRGSTPLRYASMAGRLDMVRYLVDEKHVDIQGRAGCTFLLAGRVHTDVVKYLESKGAACRNRRSVQGRSLISHEPTSNLKDIASVENLNNLTNKHL